MKNTALQPRRLTDRAYNPASNDEGENQQQERDQYRRPCPRFSRRPILCPRSTYGARLSPIDSIAAYIVQPNPGRAIAWDMGFSYTIISVFSDTYRLKSVQQDTTTPDWYAVGTNQFGALVVATYSSTLSKFALLDERSTFNEFFVFDFTGSNAVSGCYYQVTNGNLGSCYSMQGTRTSLSALTSNIITEQNQDDAQKSLEVKPVDLTRDPDALNLYRKLKSLN
jgi:hypothetical protein